MYVIMLWCNDRQLLAFIIFCLYPQHRSTSTIWWTFWWCCCCCPWCHVSFAFFPFDVIKNVKWEKLKGLSCGQCPSIFKSLYTRPMMIDETRWLPKCQISWWPPAVHSQPGGASSIAVHHTETRSFQSSSITWCFWFCCLSASPPPLALFQSVIECSKGGDFGF